MNKNTEKKPRRLPDHKKKVMHPWDSTEDTLLLNAIAKYGEKAKDGAIEIETKKNKK